MEETPKKRGCWTQSALIRAIKAVKKKKLSDREASTKYNVPRRTLRRYVKTGETVKQNLGRKAILSKEQELELCTRIFRLCDVGYPLTSKILQLNVFRYCSENGIPNTFAEGIAGRWWMKDFLKRNPEVAKRKAQKLNPARAQKLNKFIVTDHFQKLRSILLDNDLINSPHRIFNMDEKGCRLQLHKEPTVLAKKGSKRVHIVAKEHGENVSVVACVNAIGSFIPPMVLFKGVRKNLAWGKNMPEKSVIQMTPKGSMTTDAFVEFIKHMAMFKPTGKCLLIFDGAKSHLDFKICKVAEENDILLYCLPSNTTHELQPLDKCCFRSFEFFWDQHALLYFDMHKCETNISKLNFGDVFTPTWMKSMSQSNIISGFKATGIYPLNPTIIPEEAFVPSVVTEQPSPKQNAAEKISHHPQVEPGTSSMNQASDSKQCKRHRTPSSSSDSTDSEVPLQSTNSSNDCNFNESEISSAPNSSEKHSISFNELLATPKSKLTKTRNSKPAINSRGIILKKQLFQEDKTRNPVKKKKIMTKDCYGKRTGVTGKGNCKNKTISKLVESWYCTICCEDVVKDMRCCVDCGNYVHEECVGLTKKDIKMFICPQCQH